MSFAVVRDASGQAERHATREEQELLPMAERLLGTEDLERIRRWMRRRRGA